jgi:hypothetical protein
MRVSHGRVVQSERTVLATWTVAAYGCACETGMAVATTTGGPACCAIMMRPRSHPQAQAATVRHYVRLPCHANSQQPAKQ